MESLFSPGLSKGPAAPGGARPGPGAAQLQLEPSYRVGGAGGGVVPERHQGPRQPCT